MFVRPLCFEFKNDPNYELLNDRFRSQQVASDNRVSELQNEIRIKSFEAERTQMVYKETVGNHKEVQLEAEKTQKKLEVCESTSDPL